MGEQSLPESWRHIRLTEDVNFIPTGVEKYEGNKQYFSTGSVTELGNEAEGHFFYESRPSRANRIGKTGDVLQARMKNTNKCLLIKGNLDDQLFSTGFFQIKAYGDTLRPLFLYYYLSSEIFLSIKDGLCSGSTQSALNDNSAKKLFIPLAPLNEQDRIVQKIEELFSEIDKGIESLKTAKQQLKVYRQALLKHAFEGKITEQWRKDNAGKLESPEELLSRIKEEREARYQQMLDDWETEVKKWEENGKEEKKPTKPPEPKDFPEVTQTEVETLPRLPAGWKYIRLATLATVGSGMSVSKDRKIETPVEVPYLRVANVQRGLIDLSEIKYMAVEKSKLKGLMLKKWDVLFNEGGDRDKLGRGWVWDGSLSPCITQNHVFRASPFILSEFHSKFISYWGNTFGQGYFERGGKQTTNLASINKSVLSMFPIPLAPEKEQEQIITCIQSSFSYLDVVEREIDTSLEQSNIMRQSILNKAFSGNLVDQEPTDEPASELLKKIAAEKAALEAKEKEEKAASRKKPKPKKTKSKAKPTVSECETN